MTLTGLAHPDAVRRGMGVLAQSIAGAGRVDGQMEGAPQLFPHGPI